MIFLDTNIFLRVLLDDHPHFSSRCRVLLKKVETGQIEAITTDLVIAEVVFVLEAPIQGNLSKATIRQLLLPIVLLPKLSMSSKNLWESIFKLYVDKNVDFTDAYNMVVMNTQGIEKVYSYDRDFDKVRILKRLEP